MNDTIPLRTRRLTSEEILASLTDFYALNQNVNYEVPYCIGEVHGDMTVKEYRDESEIDDFGASVSFWFDLSLTREEMTRVATPAGRRTLREVCEFLATRVEVPAIDPVTILGRPCLSAGAFLTMRTILSRAGANVSRLAPSSPLEPYLRDHFMVFARDISKLAPGTFPRIEEQERPPVSLPCLAVCGAALIGLLALVIFLDKQTLSCCCWALFAFVCVPVFLWSWIRRGCTAAPTPELPGLHDFHDLVDKLLNRPLRRRALNLEMNS